MFANIKFIVSVQKVTIRGFFDPLPAPIFHHNNLGTEIYHFVFFILIFFLFLRLLIQLINLNVQKFGHLMYFALIFRFLEF